MTIIDKLSSMLDGRVASEAKWVKINQIAATAGVEVEYQWLIDSLSTVPEAARETEIEAQVSNWKYGDQEWFADQLP